MAVDWRGARAVAPGFDGLVIEQEPHRVLAVNAQAEGRWLDASAIDLEFGFLPKGVATLTQMRRVIRAFEARRSMTA